jgi:hypothetical protein
MLEHLKVNMDEQLLHGRISQLEQNLRRHKNNTAPTIPIYDLNASANGSVCIPDLCGGISAGPFASGIGNTALTMTVDRDLICDSFIQILYLCGNVNTTSFIAGAPSSITDNRGHSYVFNTLTNQARIGDVADGTGSSPNRTTIDAGSAILSLSAGSLTAGDTITITFSGGVSGAFHSMAIALAFVCVSEFASNQEDGISGVTYGNSDSYPNNSSNPLMLNWATDVLAHPTPAVDSAMFVIHGAYPAVSGFSPTEGIVLGTLDDVFSLGVSFVPFIRAHTPVKPDASWGAAASILVGNYQFASLL